MSYATHAGHRRLNWGEAAMSNTYFEMSESTGKLRKIYVDYLKGKYKPTCLINISRHSLYECNVLGDFGPMCVKSRPTKHRRHDPVSRKKFKEQKDNNNTVNSSVDGIILQENQKVSSEKGAH